LQFVDYLTGEFLEEQHKGSRDLAGKLSTLGKMMKNNGQLAEFLFDKKLLAGDV
jgi:ferritin heavy chain